MGDNLQKTPPSKSSFITIITEYVKKIWAIRFFRFLFVGGINSLFGYLIYSIFILIGLHFALASFLSTLVGIIFNFFTTGKIVFQNKNPWLIFRFFGVYGITYLINVGCLKIFEILHVDMIVAGAILLLPIAVISFFLNRALVFRNKDSRLEPE